MGDLLTVSFAVALFLTVAKNNWPEDFLRYGLSGGAIIALAMVLALLRASRKGYPSGMARRIYGFGCVLSVLGGSSVAALGFVDIVRNDVYMNANDRWFIIGTQVFGSASLVAGQSLCLLAVWIRKHYTLPAMNELQVSEQAA